MLVLRAVGNSGKPEGASSNPRHFEGKHWASIHIRNQNLEGQLPTPLVPTALVLGTYV